MVLSVSMILMITGLSALVASRIQRRGSEGGNDLGAASLYAQSAIDLGMYWIENDSAWRTSRGEGSWAVKQLIGQGSFSLEANDLGSTKLLEASADTDSVLLTGTGFKGQAEYKLQVTLTPYVRGLDCLEVALDAGVDLTFSSTLSCDHTVSANGNIIATGASGTSNLEALGTIDPGGIVGTQTTLSNPRTLPASTVFDYYVDPLNGTAIDINALEQQSSTALLRRVVLSPASNPYPPYNTNGEGIYIINCAGQDIYIQECRIVGTLVLLNPGPGSDMFSSVNWVSGVPDYPALLVSGDMRISLSSAPLLESPDTGSLNPPGTPYGGVEDTDTTDKYPSLIKGLVYVSGNMTISNDPVFDGVVVVGGSLVAPGNMILQYVANYLDNPPPGFAAPVQIFVSPASWMQVLK
jgi:hypothetical protein